ncbi:MAG: hypothetical protein HKO02_08075 [Hyphomonadaceae bacterium]|nr:hypothetical protein [Hyphomonadaceae bacterium]
MQTNDQSVLIFDIGKTHVKVTLLDESGARLYQNRTSNRVKKTKPYDSYDIDHTWSWFLSELSGLTPQFNISSISIATHGAAAALINPDTEDLLLPIMDYEFEAYPDNIPDYKSLRPAFDVTGSPDFPAGLNLGRQLNWQSQLLSESVREKAALLMYPQYWAWRLTGKLGAEITSLGCHTDLWDIRTNCPSALLKKLGLENSLPPLMNAWEPLGPVRTEIADQVGLNSECHVYPGVHDSNAGYIPILKSPKESRPTVVSSGTWSVIMDSQADVSTLDPARDMLVNIDAEGSPLATARYMGGREFGLICERLNTDIATTFSDEDVHEIIESKTLILPSFCAETGPYPNASGRIIFENEKFEINGKAAATIYSALMVNDILKRLNPNSRNDILIEGSFAANVVLCRLLANLNPNRKVRIQNRGNGVTEGCFLITRWNAKAQNQINSEVSPYPSDSFRDYARLWEDKLQT